MAPSAEAPLRDAQGRAPAESLNLWLGDAPIPTVETLLTDRRRRLTQVRAAAFVGTLVLAATLWVSLGGVVTFGSADWFYLTLVGACLGVLTVIGGWMVFGTPGPAIIDGVLMGTSIPFRSIVSGDLGIIPPKEIRKAQVVHGNDVSAIRILASKGRVALFFGATDKPRCQVPLQWLRFHGITMEVGGKPPPAVQTARYANPK